MSHIIPKFVFDWMKNTSGGGALRHSDNPNIRQQDGIKIPLLCGDCEQLFGKSESWFSKNIFYKVNSDDYELDIKYDHKLSYFIVSVLWRILILQLDEFTEEFPSHKKIAIETEALWRKYLLTLDSCSPKKLLLVFTTSDVQGENLVENFIYWFARGVDGKIKFEHDNCYVYAKFSRFILIGDMKGLDYENFPNTEVSYEGGRLIYPPNELGISNNFLNYFMKRIEHLNSRFKTMSQPQRDKIDNRLHDNKAKLLNTDFLDIELRNRGLTGNKNES